jgi:uncharacterized protein
MTNIEMHSGTFFDLLVPDSDQVDIKDIAHHMAQTCRFNGATSRFYSVAEHSYRVAAVLERSGQPLHVVFAGLMHDAHEAYTGDLTTPFKKMLGPIYTECVSRLDTVIAQKFRIDRRDLRSRQVHMADMVMLTVEIHWLMKSQGKGIHWKRLPVVTPDVIESMKPACCDPETAEKHFISWFNRLQARMMQSDEYPRFSPTYIGG